MELVGLKTQKKMDFYMTARSLEWKINNIGEMKRQ